MLSAGAWKLSQQNLITFVLVDAAGSEVAGLGNGFTLQISKAGGAFVASAGTKAEIGSGWYSYRSTAAEANTVGPVAVKVTHGAIVQQNLEYVCETRTVFAIEFTYTVTDSVTGDPLDGVYVVFSTDSAGTNPVWAGHTDSFGVARDSNGELPRLDAGTYYVKSQKSGYQFPLDTEVVG
jgi:hypothetical protein